MESISTPIKNTFFLFVGCFIVASVISAIAIKIDNRSEEAAEIANLTKSFPAAIPNATK